MEEFDGLEITGLLTHRPRNLKANGLSSSIFMEDRKGSLGRYFWRETIFPE